MRHMSYDLAVWDGPKPASNADASAEYERRMDAMEEALDGSGEPAASTERIKAFVEAALARFPELDDNSGPDDSGCDESCSFCAEAGNSCGHQADNNHAYRYETDDNRARLETHDVVSSESARCDDVCR